MKKQALNKEMEIIDKLSQPILVTDEGSSNGVFTSETRKTQKVVVPLVQMGENRVRNLIEHRNNDNERDEL